MSGSDSASRLEGTEAVTGAGDSAGREIADGDTVQSELDAPRSEPWWSQLAALMEGTGASR